MVAQLATAQEASSRRGAWRRVRVRCQCSERNVNMHAALLLTPLSPVLLLCCRSPLSECSDSQHCQWPPRLQKLPPGDVPATAAHVHIPTHHLFAVV